MAEIEKLTAQLERLRARLLDREEKFVAKHAELVAANRALARLGVWADTCGAALVPSGGAADTYGDGVRACKAQVKALLSSQPEAPTRFTYVDGDDAERDARLRADGFTPVQSAAPEPPKTQVIDLFEALKKSLEESPLARREPPR